MTKQFKYEEHWVYSLTDLNEYGKCGWALVCFCEFNKPPTNRTGDMALFKREITPTPPVQNSDEPRGDKGGIDEALIEFDSPLSQIINILIRLEKAYRR